MLTNAKLQLIGLAEGHKKGGDEDGDSVSLHLSTLHQLLQLIQDLSEEANHSQRRRLNTLKGYKKEFVYTRKACKDISSKFQALVPTLEKLVG